MISAVGTEHLDFGLGTCIRPKVGLEHLLNPVVTTPRAKHKQHFALVKGNPGILDERLFCVYR